MRFPLLQLSAWISWRNTLWLLLGVTLLAMALWVVRSPLRPSEPLGTIGARSVRPAIDPAFLSTMEAARQEAVELGQRRLTGLIGTLSQRVETNFLPHYLSFGRRKLEEIRAYNTFAWGQIKALFGGERLDAAVPILIATFDEDFTDRVLTPLATRGVLRNIGREVARQYAMLVAAGLQKLQESRGIPFAQWQRYLEGIPPGQVQVEGQAPLDVPVATLAAPDPMRDRLGVAIGTALEGRFSSFPKVTADLDGLRMPDGKSIFDVGRNVWAYYGSYVVYWIVLIILLRSGIVPINLFAFLLGWLAWETFVWGTWIGLESIDFEQTKAQLEPIILHQTDTYFAGMRAILTDPGSGGPFQILWGVEQAWQSN
jgi:hypothetical protein